MRLTKVRIFGFKTFADKTDFSLDGGTVAVVGPNGCGKSNLVDAILWGLGEGNARQLRAASGQDVIFNGSSKRKPVGFAEVELLFDNSDGALPAPTSEVLITRRLTRGGDASYAINNKNCRLKDVLDLLADSGLGRAGYSIVGQKEIDQALAASPEDRRAWIDEAAGVQRYRLRKLDSLRRLNAAQGHLQRVTDILAEIELQREPLREEAEVAKRYKRAQEALQGIEVGLLARDLLRTRDTLISATEKIQAASSLTEKERAHAVALEERQGKLNRELEGLRAEANSLRDQLQAASERLLRAESSRQLAEQKLESLENLEGSLFEDESTTRSRLESLQAELEQSRIDEQSELKVLEELKDQLTKGDADAKALSARLSEIDSILGEAKKRQAEHARLVAAAAHATERKRAIRRELKGIDETLPELRQGVTESENRVSGLKAEVGELESALEVQEAELKQAEDVDHAKQRDTLSLRSSLEGRLLGIRATLESHEGLQVGAKAVMDAVDGGLLAGHYRPVGEAIHVEREVAVAIESALGGASNDLIVDSPDDAKRAIEFLKEHRLGRATFQPIPLMRPQAVERELRELLGRPGVVGRASELVECEDRVRPVIESLLGQVVVVESLDRALSYADTRGWNRLVTLEGEIVHHRGSVTGGVSAKAGFGIIQRRAEVEALERELEDLLRHETSKTKSTGQLAKRREELVVKRSEITDRLLERRDELADAEDWLQSVKGEFNDTERARKRLEDELNKLDGSYESAEPEDLATLENERDQVIRRLAGRSADVEQFEVRLRESEARASQAQLRALLAGRRLDAAYEAENARQRKVGNLGPERAKATRELESAIVEAKEAEVLKGQVQEALALAEKAGQFVHEQLGEVQDQIRASRYSADDAQQNLQKWEIDRARAEAKRVGILARLLEEYDINEQAADHLAVPDDLPADAGTVVSQLRRELRLMGDVNVGAIEAFERLTIRFEELHGQLEDIQGGIKEVQEGIRELDGLTKDKFLEAFSRVGEAFSDLFRRIFEGGEAQVRLTEADNVLESGIEIDVTLPGKRRQRLELLSGGERSLCATAFLFALLRVKPSPLVVLDEVDAPLDGRNVERFIDLLGEFSGTTQFIVITHNDLTIRAMETWLGVTMNEPGVSTLVPVRMRKEEPVSA
ncbi:MAG TPA: chromosome segregation protein SMC [Fimbriimonadaceae bacterium]|nr:chromosome segregation protein SMC [Fimbriimonadaceae bacterium]